MGPRNGKQPRGINQCEEDPEALPANDAEALSGALAFSQGDAKHRPDWERVKGYRRVAESPERDKLFRSAEPPDQYLVELSQARVLLPQRGLQETLCRVDQTTGELLCAERSIPVKKDCRHYWCPGAALMRMRLIVRLRKSYALERSRRGGQS